MAKQNRFASEIYQFASEILASQAKHFGLSCAAKSPDGLSKLQRQHTHQDSG
jgi:hypothetical protein